MFEPFFPCSSIYINVVPTASTTIVITSAVASRLRSFECSWVSPRAILRSSPPRSWSSGPRNMEGLSRRARTCQLDAAPVLERPADQPVMPERIREATLPKAVRLVRDREDLRRALLVADPDAVA